MTGEKTEYRDTRGGHFIFFNEIGSLDGLPSFLPPSFTPLLKCHLLNEADPELTSLLKTTLSKPNPTFNPSTLLYLLSPPKALTPSTPRFLSLGTIGI